MNNVSFSAILKPIETALNAYLMCDEHSKKRLAKAAGKSLQVELLPFHLTFTCTVTPDNIALSTNTDSEPDTKIQGTPLQLAGAALSRSNRHKFFADDLSIEGDAEFAQLVIDLFEKVEIDWEEHLAQLIGDVPAYKISKFKHRLQRWLKHSTSSFTQDISDFLHEEAAWFPVREELDDFFDDIDTLRMDTDRLESRIATLKAKTDKEDKQ